MEFLKLKHYNVILIGFDDNFYNWCTKKQIEIELIENTDYNFNDLTHESQILLLEKSYVKFQGKMILLKSLIKEESFPFLKS